VKEREERELQSQKAERAEFKKADKLYKAGVLQEKRVARAKAKVAREQEKAEQAATRAQKQSVRKAEKALQQRIKLADKGNKQAVRTQAPHRQLNLSQRAAAATSRCQINISSANHSSVDQELFCHKTL
jgi:hypothetical protein